MYKKFLLCLFDSKGLCLISAIVLGTEFLYDNTTKDLPARFHNSSGDQRWSAAYQEEDRQSFLIPERGFYKDTRRNHCHIHLAMRSDRQGTLLRLGTAETLVMFIPEKSFFTEWIFSIVIIFETIKYFSQTAQFSVMGINCNFRSFQIIDEAGNKFRGHFTDGR